MAERKIPNTRQRVTADTAKEALATHGTYRAAARALGIPASTLQGRVAKPPISQDETKVQTATRDEIIAEILRVINHDTTRVVTRNHFRNESRYAESAWIAHFGTWDEAKRAAGVTLSRHQHRLGLNIAKHASVEAMRSLSASRLGYEDKYLRPSGSRFQTLLHATDLHDKECDPFVLRILVETAQRVQPEKIILGGDLFDLPEFGKYGVDPREWDVVGRIKAAHGILRSLRNAAPNAEMVLVEGNHEYRLLRHLAEESPAIRVVLSDLHGFTVPRLLGLDEFEINYIARGDLGTFTQRDIAEELNRNFYIAWDAYLVHHFPHGEKMGFHGGNGHHHRHWVHQHYSPDRGAYHWTQLAACHRRLASYTAGEQWGLGFQIAHVDTHTKSVADEYVHIQNHAMVGGRMYFRAATEN
jgi:hypothetical protein